MRKGLMILRKKEYQGRILARKVAGEEKIPTSFDIYQNSSLVLRVAGKHRRNERTESLLTYKLIVGTYYPSFASHQTAGIDTCYVDIRSQEYDTYTPLYKSLSLSKSVFFACFDLVFAQNTFSTKVCTSCRQHHHQITIEIT